MNSLQEKLISALVLALPYAEGRLTQYTDGCDIQIEHKPLQEQGDEAKKPIMYWFGSVTSSERVYDTTQRECLAIVWTMSLLRPYVEGTRFTIRTNHDSLRWIRNLSEAFGRLPRWRQRLFKLDLDLVPHAGAKHSDAEALLRLRTDRENTTLSDDD